MEINSDLNYEKEIKESMPWEHYMKPVCNVQIQRKLLQDCLFLDDEEAKYFALNFLGTVYQISWPDFEVTHDRG